jgi:hypothetical protein
MGLKTKILDRLALVGKVRGLSSCHTEVCLAARTIKESMRLSIELNRVASCLLVEPLGQHGTPTPLDGTGASS